MASHGFPWLPMASHGFPWLPMASHGFPWLPMASHGFPWLWDEWEVGGHHGLSTSPAELDRRKKLERTPQGNRQREKGHGRGA